MANNSGYATCTRKECFAYRAEWNRHINVCTILWNNDFVGGGQTIARFSKQLDNSGPIKSITGQWKRHI